MQILESHLSMWDGILRSSRSRRVSKTVIHFPSLMRHHTSNIFCFAGNRRGCHRPQRGSHEAAGPEPSTESHLAPPKYEIKSLVVAVHGGSYTRDYFDANENHSIRHVSQFLGIPVIAINRPWYQSTSPVPAILAHSSFIQDEGRYLHPSILPCLRKQHASSLVSHLFSCTAIPYEEL
jgi:hypothetical protein